MISVDNWRPATVALVLALAGCASGDESAERAEEATPAAEVAAQEESGAAAGEAATPAAEAAGEPAAEAPTERPAGVAPATPGERPAMRNWMLLEFARAVEDEDLQWLEANGFHVDTLMSETLVRGWLERPEGGEVIAKDPRIAQVHAQMR